MVTPENVLPVGNFILKLGNVFLQVINSVFFISGQDSGLIVRVYLREKGLRERSRDGNSTLNLQLTEIQRLIVSLDLLDRENFQVRYLRVRRWLVGWAFRIVRFNHLK